MLTVPARALHTQKRRTKKEVALLFYFCFARLHSTRLKQFIRINTCSKVTLKLNHNSARPEGRFI